LNCGPGRQRTRPLPYGAEYSAVEVHGRPSVESPPG
jgi:hypothetical protein